MQILVTLFLSSIVPTISEFPLKKMLIHTLSQGNRRAINKIQKTMNYIQKELPAYIKVLKISL